ncbi:6-bladed beta-propeller [Parabacteroides goldsteinii]|uniref:6-bladed beta-propeller n=1 Tax=Parabacteroides goldsteinii TaxID=328812 RepID=UPI002672DCDB|nr:6-bladed beta-propeller [Parabacteroides goldsteinii]
MKQTHIYILGVILVSMSILGACRKEEKNLVSEDGFIHIPFAKGIEEEKTVKLSDIADKVEYIWLELTDSSLLNNTINSHTVISDKYVFVHTSNAIFQFGRDGHFIRRVGRYGQGPEEYLAVSFLDILLDKNELYAFIPDYWKLYVYDMETGMLLRQIAMIKCSAIDFLMYDDTTIVAFSQSLGKSGAPRLTLGNFSGDILKQYYHPVIDKKGTNAVFMGKNYRFTYRYDNKIQYKEYYVDTLYHVGLTQLEPRYIFDLGPYSLPVERRIEYTTDYMKDTKSYLRYDVYETDNYILMPYMSWSAVYQGNFADKEMAIYKKKDGSCFKISGGILENDLSGGVPMVPEGVVDDNSIFSIWTVDALYEEAEKNPQIQKLLEKNNVQFDDNPMIMIARLK